MQRQAIGGRGLEQGCTVHFIFVARPEGAGADPIKRTS